MTDIEGNPIFIVENGQLLSLASRFTRTSCLPKSTSSTYVFRSPLPLRTIPLVSLADFASAVVIRHFNSVESLFGLPEDIGRILFHIGVKMGLFICDDDQVPDLSPELQHALAIFSEAFPSVFIARLDLSGVTYSSFLAGMLTSLANSVTELRLDNCKLDAVDSEILSLISDMPLLKRLSIRDNHLWDERLRCLTAGWRYRKQNCKLSEIDVRGNEYISHRCVAFFLEIPTLKKVVFSSSQELEDHFPIRECCRLRWKLKRLADVVVVQSGCTGWFSEIEEDWIHNQILSSISPTENVSGKALIMLREVTEVVMNNNISKRRRLCNDEDLNRTSAEENDILSSYCN